RPSLCCRIVDPARRPLAVSERSTAKDLLMALIDLPLLMKDHVRGKRSPVTCALKCGNQCALGPCNHSDNPSFRDIVSSAISRRTLLGGTTAAIAIGVAGTQGALAAPAGPAPAAPAPALAPSGTPLDFTAIESVAAD